MESLASGHAEPDSSRRRRVAWWALALAGLAAAAAGLWWLTHPKVFHEVNSEHWAHNATDDGIGSVNGDLRDFCTAIVDLTAEPLLALAPEANESIVLTVTPRQPGRVRVVGMDLTYRHGWQRGSQAVGEHVVARFTEEGSSN